MNQKTNPLIIKKNVFVINIFPSKFIKRLFEFKTHFSLDFVKYLRNIKKI